MRGERLGEKAERAAHESSPSRDGTATRPARRRWRIPLLLTLFAFLFMYAAERHADQLRQSPAAYEMAARR